MASSATDTAKSGAKSVGGGLESAGDKTKDVGNTAGEKASGASSEAVKGLKDSKGALDSQVEGLKGTLGGE